MDWFEPVCRGGMSSFDGVIILLLAFTVGTAFGIVATNWFWRHAKT